MNVTNIRSALCYVKSIARIELEWVLASVKGQMNQNLDIFSSAIL